MTLSEIALVFMLVLFWLFGVACGTLYQRVLDVEENALRDAELEALRAQAVRASELDVVA